MTANTGGSGRRSVEIRSARPPKEPVDPRVPIALIREEERTASGALAPSLTVLLAGAECPFTCVFCDLWRHTLDEPTAPGALVAQLAEARSFYGAVAPEARIKLYNASNFFDERAVPSADLDAIADLVSPFSRVVVECHPRLVDVGCAEFDARLAGQLEVAMGLECVHPEALPRLNKQMSLGDWDRACDTLRSAGIPIRAFVLIGPPFLGETERVDWAVLSAAYALESGAETVSLIPLRTDSPIDGLRSPSLAEIEETYERALDLESSYLRDYRRAVLLDTWDLESFGGASACDECREPRLARLHAMNLSGERPERLHCEVCGGS